MNKPLSPATHADATMRATFDAQRAAFLRDGAPSRRERLADLKKLGDAIGGNVDRLAAAISADFGNRSRHETELGEVFPIQTAIRHARRHLSAWMAPKPVSVRLELMPAGARILYQPVGVVGIISPWNYPLNLAIVPMVAALAAGNRVMLKPSELTPRTADLMADCWPVFFRTNRSPPSSAVPRSARPSRGCRSIICSIPDRPPSAGW